jgi:hypothetical protein
MRRPMGNRKEGGRRKEEGGLLLISILQCPTVPSVKKLHVEEGKKAFLEGG